MRLPYLPFLGKAEGLDDNHLTVTLNGDSFPLKVQNSVFYTRLRLGEGVNAIRLSAENRTLWEGEVFGMGPGDGALTYARVSSGHRVGSRQECLACHPEEGGAALVASIGSAEPCFSCHEGQKAKKFLHGPVAVGECLSCHDPHGGRGPSHLRAEGQSLCLGCHSEGDIRSHKGGSAARGGNPCVDCHDPHQSDDRYLVRVASGRGLPPEGRR